MTAEDTYKYMEYSKFCKSLPKLASKMVQGRITMMNRYAIAATSMNHSNRYFNELGLSNSAHSQPIDKISSSQSVVCTQYFIHDIDIYSNVGNNARIGDWSLY